jgi:hypothetical protein
MFPTKRKTRSKQCIERKQKMQRVTYPMKQIMGLPFRREGAHSVRRVLCPPPIAGAIRSRLGPVSDWAKQVRPNRYTFFFFLV